MLCGYKVLHWKWIQSGLLVTPKIVRHNESDPGEKCRTELLLSIALINQAVCVSMVLSMCFQVGSCRCMFKPHIVTLKLFLMTSLMKLKTGVALLTPHTIFSHNLNGYFICFYLVNVKRYKRSIPDKWLITTSANFGSISPKWMYSTVHNYEIFVTNWQLGTTVNRISSSWFQLHPHREPQSPGRVLAPSGWAATHRQHIRLIWMIIPLGDDRHQYSNFSWRQGERRHLRESDAAVLFVIMSVKLQVWARVVECRVTAAASRNCRAKTTITVIKWTRQVCWGIPSDFFLRKLNVQH